VSVERFESSTKKIATNEISAYFGPRPLLKGEDSESYERLVAIVNDLVRPGDIFERFWVEDIVYWQWDVDRNRRLKAAHINAARLSAVGAVLTPLFLEGVQGWRSDPRATKEMEKVAMDRDYPPDAILAQAVAMKSGDVTGFDRMIVAAETRRNGALREIQRHRETFGAELKRAVDAVDADFEVVAKPSLKSIDQQEPTQQQKAA
jgi:hypothetical protein